MSNDVPVLGETFMRLRNFVIIKNVLEGGVYDPSSIPPQLLEDMYLVGNRPGHYQGFVNLMRNVDSWETATTEYKNVNIPVLMVWGDEDWSTPEERKRDGELEPGAQMVTVERGGHFLPLDDPQAVIDEIRRFQATAVD